MINKVFVGELNACENIKTILPEGQKLTHSQSTLEPVFEFITDCVKSELEDIKKIANNIDKRIVYIAGKVTNLDPIDVAVKFNKRKAELLDAGYIVINPCDYISPTTDWRLAMAICFVLLPHANYISLLHDWQDSKGATMEKEFADKMGIEILKL